MNGSEATLKDYIAVVRKRMKLILAGMLVCAVIAAVVSLIMPKTYQSSLILEVGKIYLPPSERQSQQEVELLEEPDSTAQVIESDATHKIGERPQGTYEIELRHPTLGTVTKTAELRSGQECQVTHSFGVEEDEQ